MLKRRLISCLALAAFAMPNWAAADNYPSRQIRLVVGFPAGQSSDAIARIVAQTMSADLKQNVWVDNKPGASGIIAHEDVRRASADGYTLLFASTTTLALNPSMFTKLPYDPPRDFEVVGTLNTSPMYLFAAPGSPVNSVKEMIAYVKARPGKVAYGTGGMGLTNHVAMEMLKGATGMDMLHVPYKGSPPMITDLIGGRVEFAFEPSISILPMAKAGRVKLIGVASAKRDPLTPDVPAIAEQLPGFEASVWGAIVAPKGTPAAVVRQLNASINRALQNEAVLAEMSKLGASPMRMSVEEADAFVKREAARWGKAVKDAGVRLD